MTPFVAYDVTRLLLRYAQDTPNGIDRIDLAYACHFIAATNTTTAGVFLKGSQPAPLESSRLAPLLAIIENNWRDGWSNESPTYTDVKGVLLGKSSAWSHNHRSRTLGEKLRKQARRLVPLRVLNPRTFKRALLERLPGGAVFVHTTHYPFEKLFRWLDARGDVKPVFFIHDLLPLQFPEYFEPDHIAWHRRSLDIFAHYGRAAIVNTRVTENQIRGFLQSRGRHDVPILALPMPSDAIFSTRVELDRDLAEVPYFVMCGTIEPRKNQLMVLQVWRELVRQWGSRAPKLLLIGQRGWENENIVDLLERSSAIYNHVIEVSDLPTAAMAQLMAGARALLMPSFGEGYGLPIVEARAIGIPIIASDIPVFREIAPEATLRHPLDGTGWLDAIKGHAENNLNLRAPRSTANRSTNNTHSATMAYFSDVENFLRSL